MNIKDKLQNPFALIAQGFVAGAVLFWSTMPKEAELPQQQPTQIAAVEQTDIA